MTTYDQWPPDHQFLADRERMESDRNWSPPGGTSRNRHAEIAERRNIAFLAALTARVTARETELWIKSYASFNIDVGWHDDPGGTYSVVSGLERQPYVAPELLRSPCYLTYRHEADHPPKPAEDAELARTYFEPPYALDVQLSADYVMAWLDAHRRHLDATRKGAT